MNSGAEVWRTAEATGYAQWVDMFRELERDCQERKKNLAMTMARFSMPAQPDGTIVNPVFCGRHSQRTIYCAESFESFSFGTADMFFFRPAFSFFVLAGIVAALAIGQYDR